MSIEKRASRRHGQVYEVRLRDQRGREYSRTFRTRREAIAWESQQRADRNRGTWVDPRSGRVSLKEYADRWMTLRSDLKESTRALYESELRRHILPALGGIDLAKLTPANVRTWHSSLVAAPAPGASTVAKCYRLLRAILNTAVEDEVIVRNPCVVKGAGVERSAERPTASISELDALTSLVEPRYRALIILAAWCSLRLGELLGLTREDFDLVNGTVRVVGQRQEVKGIRGRVVPPKSEAGYRVVTIPPPAVSDIREHLDRVAGPAQADFVFTGPKGGPLRRATFYKAWRLAKSAAGIDAALKPHDLRHTGNTLAAATGASTKELMARMGQSSARAALLYQHATQDRDEAIAKALGDLMTGAKQSPKPAVMKLVRGAGHPVRREATNRNEPPQPKADAG